MNRRSFLKSLAAASTAGLAAVPRADAALPKAKITRVRIYEPPSLAPRYKGRSRPITVETDIGITGVGEGGAKETLEHYARTLIGKNPFKIEQIWQEMFLEEFNPPGRETMHALGAMDLALWDIKGKVLKVPVHELLGGTVRTYCDCYPTGGVLPWDSATQVSLGDRARARATLEAGYRVFRIVAGDNRMRAVFDSGERVRQLVQDCKQIREAIGRKGEWSIDFHQRFDYSDALRACKLIEDDDPFLVEDPVHDVDAFEDLPRLRRMTTVPLAHGEGGGHRWTFNKLVENHDIDYLRATVPGIGGITELMKVATLCETHSVGIVPHFTGPVATAAMLHCLATFPGPVLFEYNFRDQPISYLPEFLDFRKGKLYPNDRPGLGVTLDLKKVKLIGEVTETARPRYRYVRPDGSMTHS